MITGWPASCRYTGCAVLLDGVDGVGDDALAFVGDRGVEAREVDHAQRLGAEDERIVLHALGIDPGFKREIADLFQALGRILVDAAVEQAGGDEVLGLLQRAAQRHRACAMAVIVLRRPIVGADPGNRRQRDRLVDHQRVRLQAAMQRRKVGEGLDR